MAEQPQTVNINNEQYNLDDLSEAAKNQIMNLRVADARISQMQQDLALMQTARNAYARALQENLPK